MSLGALARVLNRIEVRTTAPLDLKGSRTSEQREHTLQDGYAYLGVDDTGALLLRAQLYCREPGQGWRRETWVDRFVPVVGRLPAGEYTIRVGGTRYRLARALTDGSLPEGTRERRPRKRAR